MNPSTNQRDRLRTLLFDQRLPRWTALAAGATALVLLTVCGLRATAWSLVAGLALAVLFWLARRPLERRQSPRRVERKSPEVHQEAEPGPVAPEPSRIAAAPRPTQSLRPEDQSWARCGPALQMGAGR
jgi:hypothetical protein